MTNPPTDSEVEISLIGTGGGYGETVLIKIAKDSWIIIDSCINPFTREPLALEYLSKIGVDFSCVNLIVCTHWHNDHIKGLAKVLSECKNAEFCFSSVHDLDKFLLLCEIDYSKTLKGSISSTNEFASCLEIINNRETQFTRAQCNLILYSTKIDSVEFILYALSPSPKTIADFDSEISELITDFGERSAAIINKSPNEKSVALLLKFGEHRVLLGSDLEVGKDDNEGWRHIVKHSKVIDENKSKLYKIPHHGSHNGYLDKIFNLLVDSDSILKLTPYKSSGIPREEMLEKYSEHSNTIYLTSNTVISKKPKKRSPSIEKMISRSAISLIEARFSQGIVRSRLDFSIPGETWKVELFEAAQQYLKVV